MEKTWDSEHASTTQPWEESEKEKSKRSVYLSSPVRREPRTSSLLVSPLSKVYVP